MTNNGIQLPPDYGMIFYTMLRDVRNTEPWRIFGDLKLTDVMEAEALRAVERFIAPLALAAQTMTTPEQVERFRSALADILAALDKAAGEIESELGGESDPGPDDGYSASWEPGQ